MTAFSISTLNNEQCDFNTKGIWYPWMPADSNYCQGFGIRGTYVKKKTYHMWTLVEKKERTVPIMIKQNKSWVSLNTGLLSILMFFCERENLVVQTVLIS